LLWGDSEKTTIEETDDNVNITLGHKFPRVEVKFTTDSLSYPMNILDISGVTLSGSTANLTSETGKLNTGTALKQALNFKSFNSHNVTSTPRTVFNGGKSSSSVELGIRSITFDGYPPVTNLTAAFDKKLEKGISYTLKVTFRSHRFITAEPDSIILSPGVSKQITIDSSSDWNIPGGDPDNASLSTNSGPAGTSVLTLTGGNSAFGKRTFTISNATGDEAVVTVDNFFIKPEKLYIANAQSNINTGEYDISVFGGSAQCAVVDSSTWISSATILPNGRLQFTAGYNNSLISRVGFITLAHADDPDYQVTFEVIQDNNIMPAFDYLAVKITWKERDADMVIEFWDPDFSTNNPGLNLPSFYNNLYPIPSTSKGSRAVGYMLATHLDIAGTPYNFDLTNTTRYPKYNTTQLRDNLIFWGGDAYDGQGEMVFVNAKKLNPEDPLNDKSGWPRYVYLQVYAAWNAFESQIPLQNTITMEISTYSGGVMRQGSNPKGDCNEFNFYNTSDPSLETVSHPSQTNNPNWKDTRDVPCPIAHRTSNYNMNFRTNKMHFCTVEYDRYTHSARAIWRY
jgi:hypothetical protein